MKLNYTIGYLDLTRGVEVLFSELRCRNEVRRAEREGLVFHVLSELNEKQRHSCAQILNETLSHKKIEYSDVYDTILSSQNMTFVLAEYDGLVVSFVSVELTNRNPFFGSSAIPYLSLSATSVLGKKKFANYGVLWRAIVNAVDGGHKYFNLGLLEYVHCVDKSLSSLAQYKRRWGILEHEEEENVSLWKYVYYRYLKSISLFRWLLYMCKKITHYVHG